MLIFSVSEFFLSFKIRNHRVKKAYHQEQIRRTQNLLYILFYRVIALVGNSHL